MIPVVIWFFDYLKIFNSPSGVKFIINACDDVIL